MLYVVSSLSSFDCLLIFFNAKTNRNKKFMSNTDVHIARLAAPDSETMGCQNIHDHRNSFDMVWCIMWVVLMA